MSSLARRLELKIKRKKGLMPPRHLAIRALRGTPYRRCVIEQNPTTGATVILYRYT